MTELWTRDDIDLAMPHSISELSAVNLVFNGRDPYEVYRLFRDNAPVIPMDHSLRSDDDLMDD